MEPHWLFACQSQRGYVFGSSHEPQSEFGAASRKCTDWLCLAGLVCTGGRAAQQRSRCLQRSVLDCKTDPAKPPRALRLLCNPSHFSQWALCAMEFDRAQVGTALWPSSWSIREQPAPNTGLFTCISKKVVPDFAENATSVTDTAGEPPKKG